VARLRLQVRSQRAAHRVRERERYRRVFARVTWEREGDPAAAEREG
jgi:hypothetical protein